MARRRKVFWIASVAALVIIAITQSSSVFWALVLHALDPSALTGCQSRETTTEAVSPDGAWIATAYANICIVSPWATSYSESVEVRSSQEPPSPTPKRPVFGKESVLNDPPPTVTWLAPRILQITIPNLSRIGPQKTEFSDISIVYRYVPDDPVDRICWNRWLDWTTDIRSLDGPNLSREDFFARCRGTPAGPPR
jgi:hypothetical protein